MEMKNYYVTLTVVGWIDVFTRKEYVQEFMNSLQYWQEKNKLHLFAYVILSNHVHLILGETGEDIGDMIARFKFHTATQLIRKINNNRDDNRGSWLMHMLSYFGKYEKDNANFQFWQHEEEVTELRGQDQLMKKIAFLYSRPVVSGLVSDPRHYIYSSANPLNQVQIQEVREESGKRKRVFA
jgi:putative transposase